MALLLETMYGDLVIDLDVKGSPALCRNVLQLARARYYTNTLIFSVAPQRYCHAGCPVGDGTGGACLAGLLDAAAAADNDNDTADYRRSPRRFLRSVGRPLTPIECAEKGRVVATPLGMLLLSHTATATTTPDTIGSQFLITLAAGPDRALDGISNNISNNDGGSGCSTTTPFLSLGRVTEDAAGVLDRINAAYTDPRGRPYADIRIIRALVVHDPFAAAEAEEGGNGGWIDAAAPGRGGDSDGRLARFLARRGVVLAADGCRVVDSPSPERPLEESVPHRISAADVVVDDDTDDDDGDARSDNEDKIARQRQSRRQQQRDRAARQEDHSRAVVLEMLGDLPDASIRAPDHVLFVCKLNPATVAEDLALIFARFNDDDDQKPVVAEIIRDSDTGASLQYAFVEFSSKRAATEAYFKMNNALVDDRRIRVDFSQSVAKLWDKHRQQLRRPPSHPGAKAAAPHHHPGAPAAAGGGGPAGRGTGPPFPTGRPGGGRGGGGGGGRRGRDVPTERASDRRPRDNGPPPQQRQETDDFGRSRDLRPSSGQSDADRDGRRNSKDGAEQRHYDDHETERRHRSREPQRERLERVDDGGDAADDRGHTHRTKDRRRGGRSDRAYNARDERNRDDDRSAARGDDDGDRRSQGGRAGSEESGRRAEKDRDGPSQGRSRDKGRDSDDERDAERRHRRKKDGRLRRDSDDRHSKHRRQKDEGGRHDRRPSEDDRRRRREERSDDDDDDDNIDGRRERDRAHRKRERGEERNSKKRHRRSRSRG